LQKIKGVVLIGTKGQIYQHFVLQVYYCRSTLRTNDISIYQMTEGSTPLHLSHFWTRSYEICIYLLLSQPLRSSLRIFF